MDDVDFGFFCFWNQIRDQISSRLLTELSDSAASVNKKTSIIDPDLLFVPVCQLL